MAKGAGGPLNYPVNWELSRPVIQIPQAEANPSGVCAKAQPVLPTGVPGFCFALG